MDTGTYESQDSKRHRLAGTVVILVLGAAYIGLTNVYGLARGETAKQFPAYWIFIAFFVACLIFAAVVYGKAAGRARALPARRTLIVALSLVFILFVLLEAYLWPFDLDDKWVYYRMSKNVLTTGLPLWNADERALVGASFVYPYLVSIANLFGDWPVWDLYQKSIGIAFTLAICGIVLWRFQLNALTVLCVSAILLYEPLAQWSLGGLETSFATLWIVASICIYLFSQGRSTLFWFLVGALIYIRPDAILLGVGAFAARFLRDPRDIRGWITNGIAFSVPILLFLIQNKLLFGYPLPLVFLVKGWKCAYCGTDPIYYKAYMGLFHNLSGIVTSLVITILSLAAIWRVFRDARVHPSLSAPLTVRQPICFDLFVGLAVYMGYHIIGGYQHMNFTFRYWVPAIIGMLVVSLYVLSKATPRSPSGTWHPDMSLFERIGFSASSASVLAALLLMQSAQTALAAYQARHIDLTLTAAPQRDQFSIDSYAAYLRDWFQAGLDLRALDVRPDEKLFLMQGMLTGALTNSYLVDQFYFPPRKSKFPELRRCNSLPEDSHACDINYDYLITFADKKYWPATHESVKAYTTIAVLRRRDFPVPATPANLQAIPVAPKVVELRWRMPTKGEMHYDVELSMLRPDGRSVTSTEWVQPGARSYRVVGTSGSARIRACNTKGCSDWSAATKL